MQYATRLSVEILVTTDAPNASEARRRIETTINGTAPQHSKNGTLTSDAGIIESLFDGEADGVQWTMLSMEHNDKPAPLAPEDEKYVHSTNVSILHPERHVEMLSKQMASPEEAPRELTYTEAHSVADLMSRAVRLAQLAIGSWHDLRTPTADQLFFISQVLLKTENAARELRTSGDIREVNAEIEWFKENYDRLSAGLSQ